tara:strand:+ start:1813 stop:2232 length:420 start_codon:yes stop_codon:yes gene_type:complete
MEHKLPGISGIKNSFGCNRKDHDKHNKPTPSRVTSIRTLVNLHRNSVSEPKDQIRSEHLKTDQAQSFKCDQPSISEVMSELSNEGFNFDYFTSQDRNEITLIVNSKVFNLKEQQILVKFNFQSNLDGSYIKIFSFENHV